MTQTALEIALGVDLRPFSTLLDRQRIPHQINQFTDRQVVAVDDPRHIPAVRERFGKWQSQVLTDAAYRGELPGAMQAAGPSLGGAGGRPRDALVRLRRLALATPVITVLIALALLAYPWATLSSFGGALAIADLGLVSERGLTAALLSALNAGEWWRLATPVLLHFGLAHLLFNLSIVFEFGRRVEQAVGGTRTLALLLVSASVSNVLQYLSSGPLFGGLSGVACGLFGALLVLGWRHPANAALQLPRPMVISLLAMLVLFSTGVTEFFGLHVANAAHWGGLLAGALSAFALRTRGRLPLGQPT